MHILHRFLRLVIFKLNLCLVFFKGPVIQCCWALLWIHYPQLLTPWQLLLHLKTSSGYSTEQTWIFKSWEVSKTPRKTNVITIRLVLLPSKQAKSSLSTHCKFYFIFCGRRHLISDMYFPLSFTHCITLFTFILCHIITYANRSNKRKWCKD